MAWRMMHRFWLAQSGAVTLDWVVLTAGVVGFGVATYSLLDPGMATLTGTIADVLDSVSTDPDLTGCGKTGDLSDLGNDALRAAYTDALATGDTAVAAQAACLMAERGLD